LVFSFYYPPTGGAGVQRTSAFCTHLPDFGYAPIVVTAPEPGENGLSPDPMNPLDPSLPAGACGVIRVGEKDTRGLGRWSGGRWINRTLPSLCGEAKIWYTWLRPVNRAIPAILHTCAPDVVLITLSPFLSWRLAVAIKRCSSVPVVLDFRDPWVLDEWAEYTTKIHYRVQQRQQRRALDIADMVICNTPAAREAFEEHFGLNGDRLACITNGFSVSDFQGSGDNPMSGGINLVRCGGMGVRFPRRGWKAALGFSLFDDQVDRRARSHLYFVKALERLCERRPALRDVIRVYLVGVATEHDRRLVKESAVRDLIEMTGYIPHDKCLQYTRNATILVLNMQSGPDGHRMRTVRGQTYEYMASGRPILACLPEGDAADFVQAAGTGFVCKPNDPGAIARTLEELIDQHMNGGVKTEWTKEIVMQFERRQLTKKLARVLDQVVEKGPYVQSARSR